MTFGGFSSGVGPRGPEGPPGSAGADGATGATGPAGDLPLAELTYTSIDDTPHDLLVPLPTRKAGRVELTISASSGLGSLVSAWTRLVTARRGMGAATIVGTPDVIGTDQTEAGGEIDINADGAGNIAVTVMGEPATSISWSVKAFSRAGIG